MNDDVLTTYLNDHLTGAVAAQELATSCSANNPGTSLATFLQELVTKIKEEQEVVKNLLRRVGGEVNPVKTAVGWLGEKASRLKLENPLRAYTPLNCLEQVEGLLLGVRGKLALWDALKAIVSSDARFAGIDLDELSQRADGQLAELERYRLAAARNAFLTEVQD